MAELIFHKVFESICSQHPSRVAIESPSGNCTYLQLGEKANQIASCLRTLGLNAKEPVALFLNSDIPYVASLIGVSKAHGVFMPVEKDHPEQRVGYMLNQVAPKLAIVAESDQEQVSELLAKLASKALKFLLVLKEEDNRLKIEVVDESGNKSYPETQENYHSELIIDGNDPAYILFTSGSTGEPKAIYGRHKSLTHFLTWEIREFELDEQTKISQLAPLTFDVSLRDILVPLLVGGTLCIPEVTIKTQMVPFLRWLIDSKVSVIHMVPSLFRLLTEEIKQEQSFVKELSGLEKIMLAGEALYGRDLLNWWSLFGDRVELVNLYGPSESTLAKVFNRIPFGDIDPTAIVPLGKPIANTKVVILKNNALCMEGEIGEIHIKTPFHSLGYFGNEKMTKERFIQNPLHDEYEDILYKSGDLGKYDSDQQIHFVGRQDNQVKIAGNRVEIAEVEQALIGAPSLVQPIAVAVPRDNGEYILVCYFLRSESAVKEDEVRAFLAKRVPVYMIPTHFVSLDAYSLNVNGKIDKKSLPVPDIQTGLVYDPPATETEKRLAAIWEEVLKVEGVSRLSTFNQLGGSSLKAIQVISKMHKEFGVLIKLTDLFKNPTIAKLAQRLELSEANPYSEIPVLSPQEHYELSSAQKRVWILNHLEDEGLAYNVTAAYWLTGDLNIENLEASFRRILERHEGFRTEFLVVEGEPRQRVLPMEEISFQLQVNDEEVEYTEEEQLEKIESWYQEEINTPFDLTKAPLIRSRLERVSKNRHALITTIHHIVYDGWSKQVIIKELTSHYSAYQRNERVQFDPLRIQYKEFASWQNKLFEQQDLQKYRNYWRKKFGDHPEPLRLPTPKPRPVEKTFNGIKFTFTIDSQKTAKINSYVKEEDVTQFMFFVALMKVMLYRYSGQSDVTLGSVVTNRGNSDLENIIGMFPNTMALRTQFKATDSFKEVLQKVKKTCFEAQDNRFYPFEVLVDDLDLKRDWSRSPLFDIMIEKQESHIDDEDIEDMEGLDVKIYNPHQKPALFDMSVLFGHYDDLFYGTIEYNSDIFDQNWIDHFVEHIQLLVDTVVSNPHEQIKDLTYISQSELQRVTKDFNAQKSIPESPVSLIQLIEEKAQAVPDQVALKSGSNAYTYSQLMKLTDQLAAHLQHSKGVKPGDAIGVVLDQYVPSIIAFLAILKNGAAFVPLDPKAPSKRIETMLQQAGVSVVLGLETYTTLAVSEETSWVSLADFLDWSPGAKAFEPIATDHDPLAYILFTSGSTGVPKGVRVGNKSIVHYLQWANTYYFANQAGHHFALFTPLTFDLSLTALFSSFLRGDTLYVYDNPVVSAVIEEVFFGIDGPNTVKMTPSHVTTLEYLNGTSSQVTKVILGGEKLQSGHIALLREVNPSMDIYNEYGPTEATVACSVKKIEDSDQEITIGQPIADSVIYILDEHMNVVPEGVIGEIYIGGKGVADGYLNEEQTQERFVEAPSALEGQGSKLFKSGDLGKWLGNGEIELTGRADQQVKVRGFRVELGEVEYALDLHPNISKAVAVTTQDAAGMDYIVAFYNSYQTIDRKELKAHLSEYLPMYMIPSRFVFLEEFQLTTHGKTDRQALVDLIPAELFDQSDFAPRNTTEQQLLEFWKEVLGKKRISVNDHFFELGGHSLNAMQLFARINRSYGKGISLTDIFNYPTIIEQARLIQQRESQWYGVIEPVPVQEAYELSHAQKQIWLGDQVADDPRAYVVRTAFHLRGKLDLEAFQQAFYDLVEEEEILRTNFPLIDGEPRQVINAFEKEAFKVHVRDFSDQTESEKRAITALQEDHKAFDLKEDMLINVSMFKTAEDRYICTWKIHHIICDEWSMMIITNKFREKYEAILSGQSSIKEAPEIYYKDYSLWQKDRLEGEQLKQYEDYWMSQFDEKINKLELGTNFENLEANENNNRGEVLYEMPSSLFQRVMAFCQSEGISNYTFFLAVIDVILYRYSGKSDQVVCSPISGRVQPELEDMIGLFINVLPVRCQLSSDETFNDLLNRLRDIVLRNFQYQEYPFHMLLEKVSEKFKEPLQDHFNVGFTWHSSIPDSKNIELEFSAETLDISNETTKADIWFHGSASMDSMTMLLEYNPTRCDASRLMDRFGEVIEQILENPSLQIGDIQLSESSQSASGKQKLKLDLDL